MQRDVRARGRIGCGRQVIGIGFAGHLQHGDGQACRHFRLAGEPLGLRPAPEHGLRAGVALLGLVLHVVEGIEHQQGVLECSRRHFRQLRVIQQLNQRVDVVATQHGAQQFGGTLAADQRAFFRTKSHGSQVGSLDLGGIVHARGHAVGDEVQQELFLAGRRRFQQLDDLGGLLRGQRQRRDSQRGALGNVLAVGLQHGVLQMEM